MNLWQANFPSSCRVRVLRKICLKDFPVSAPRHIVRVYFNFLLRTTSLTMSLLLTPSVVLNRPLNFCVFVKFMAHDDVTREIPTNCLFSVSEACVVCNLISVWIYLLHNARLNLQIPANRLRTKT